MLVSYAIVAGIFGLIFGSAINAFVWRLHAGRSWVKGRSECSDCGHALAAIDLIPVLSWVMLRGKCRYCHKPIKDPPAVEVVTAVTFAASAWVLAPNSSESWIKLSIWLVMLILLIILAVYDARWMILPDKVMVPLIVVALGYAAVMSGLAHSSTLLLSYLLAGLIAGGSFFAIVFFSRGRAMGGGDIKLAFAMGLMLGLQATGVAMLVAFNVAAIVGIAMIILHRRGRRDQIPFGPFLVGGTIVAFLYGQQIVGWYLRLNGLY